MTGQDFDHDSDPDLHDLSDEEAIAHEAALCLLEWFDEGKAAEDIPAPMPVERLLELLPRMVARLLEDPDTETRMRERALEVLRRVMN